MKSILIILLFLTFLSASAENYCNGNSKRDGGGNLLYPNKNKMIDTLGNYLYPNGNKVKSFSGVIKFPNGRATQDSMGNYYYPNGKKLVSFVGAVLLPDGSALYNSSIVIEVLMDKKQTGQLTILKSKKKISNIFSVRDEYVDYIMKYNVDLSLGKISDLKCIKIFRN